MKTTTIIQLIAGVALTIPSCNTLAGFGRDMSAIGNKVSSTANRVHYPATPQVVHPQAQYVQPVVR